MRRNSVGFLVAVAFVMSVLVSCSTMHYVKVNDKQTARQVTSFYQKNGNAFYLSSTYSTVSTVWTYEENSIVICRLRNVKMRH